MTTNFSTEFPIEQTKTVQDVVHLACEWILGSPFTSFDRNAFVELPSDMERNFHTEFETVSIATAKENLFEIGGLRYVRTANGLEWTTSVVSRKTEGQHLISIQVSCEALSAAVRLPSPKKPYLIRQVLKQLGGGMDGEIPLTDSPIELSDNEEKIAVDLINGRANNALPIVYVSTCFDGSYLVNLKELAQYVCGMAHVIVEPSRTFSTQLRSLTNSRNAFGGNISIYWPESDQQTLYCIDKSTPNARALQLKIAKDVRQALANRRLRSMCTWAHLNEAIFKKRHEALKKQGSKEADQFIQLFEEELAAEKGKLRDAEIEIGRLESENRLLKTAQQAVTGGLINRGVEQDFYESEIRQVLVSSISEALRGTHANSRREHILKDLLKHNDVSDRGRELTEELKNLFKTYREMDARLRGTLEKLGFRISEEGKHYKLTYQNDGRYTFTLSKTSSDHRAGRNFSSDLCNKLF